MSAFYSWLHSHISWWPMVSMRVQKRLALILLIAQTGITFTGSIVRVTGSGLGCPTWPQCQPGSLIPEQGAAPRIHQLIEFGNRTLTFVLVFCVILVFMSALRVMRRDVILNLAFAQGLGVILQAVIGGITVLAGLAWWTVALHFIPSMILVFMGSVLYRRIGQPDDGTMVDVMPRPMRWLLNLSVVALFITLITGTLVTSAGPHAGDSEISAEHRLQIPLIEIANLHAHAMYLYLGLTVGLLCSLWAVKTTQTARKYSAWLVLGIVLQAAIGIIQYWMGVPRWTVSLHVLGSGIVTLITGLLWAERLTSTGGLAQLTGNPDFELPYTGKQVQKKLGEEKKSLEAGMNS